MNSRIVNAVLAIATLTLGIVAFQQHQTIQTLRHEVAAGTDEGIATPKQRLVVENLEVVRDTAPSTADSSEIATIEKAAPDSGSSDRIMRDFSKMMENPSMNEMMQASQRGAISVLYSDLIESLGLEGDEKVHFIDLLMARQMFRVETSMKLMSGGISDEERKTLSDEMKEYDEFVKSEIDYFLNDETDQDNFEFYEKTMQDRMSLSGLEANLAKTGNPLPEGVDEKLIRIMSEERDRFNFRSDLSDAEDYDLSPRRFSEKNIELFEKDLVELFEQIAARAAAILSAEQQAAFVENQSQMRELQVSQIRMAANMFRGSEPQP